MRLQSLPGSLRHKQTHWHLGLSSGSGQSSSGEMPAAACKKVGRICAFPPLLVNLTRATLQKNMFFARCEAKAARKKVKKPFKNHHYFASCLLEGFPLKK